MNWVDLAIIIVILAAAGYGYLRGFIKTMLDLLTLLAGLVLSFMLYQTVGNFFVGTFSLPSGFASSLGFFFILFLVEFTYAVLYILFIDRIPAKIRYSSRNKYLGIIPGVVWGVSLCWLFANLLYLMPTDVRFKEQLRTSAVGNALLRSSDRVAGVLDKTFGPAEAEATEFLTVKPQSREAVNLNFTTTDVRIDPASAKRLLDLMNTEREKNDLAPLVLDGKLTAVGQKHCEDMFAKGYFSHYSADGQSPFDRMNKAGIIFLIAGENLALAPDAETAFAGLMNSPSHKANMLSSDYNRVGLAALDGGIHGIMFAQEFTN